MRIPKLQPLAVRDKTIRFTGGLNEEAARLSLKPGELDACKNYHETAGSYSGYQSLRGYERYDGHLSPSAIDLDTAVAWVTGTSYQQFESTIPRLADVVTYGDYTFYCIFNHTAEGLGEDNAPQIDPPGDNQWWVLIGLTADLEEIDVNREFVRDSVVEPSGEGPLLGVSYFNDTAITWRKTVGNTAKMFLEHTALGWSFVGIAGDNAWAEAGSFKTVEYSFVDYNSGEPVLIIVDGTDYPKTWDGTTLVDINHANLPHPINDEAPILCGVYNNRLFLGYESGYLFFSAVGDPTNFDNIDATAGYIYLGDTLTNIIEAPGNVLVLICRNKITILKGNDYDAELLQWVPQIEEFSRSNGGFAETAQRFMGDIYYADEEGITTMSSTDTYGDFNNAIVSNKVQKTFLERKDLITSSLVDRHLNQYRVFFSDGVVLIFTFHNKQLKGVTKGEYPDPVVHSIVKEMDDGTVRKFFTSDTGYVYEMDAGTSFDGEEIETILRLSYHHYGFTRQWKFFQQITLETAAESDITLSAQPFYDYGESNMPDTIQTSLDITISEGDRNILYLYGYGNNMSLEFKTNSKYELPHIIQNMIVDFTVNSRKL